MASQSNSSWTPPPHLSISNCSAISPWSAYALESNLWLGSGWDTLMPMDVVLGFLRSLVPSNWTSPTDRDLLLWYPDFLSQNDVETLWSIVEYTLYECGSKICPYLKFSGDPDLSGIGMMVSYYMVAIFATLYYFALVPGIFEAYGKTCGSSMVVTRYREYASGFEESVTGFLNAMLLFSISMLIAAITRYVSRALHPNDFQTLFGLQDCVLLSTFTVFPALILQSLSHENRRWRVRLALWDLVIFLAITVEVLYRVYYLNYLYSDSSISRPDAANELSQWFWLDTCQSDSLRVSLERLLTVGHVVMGLNVTAWIYNIIHIFVEPRWLPVLQNHTRLLRAWVTFRLHLSALQKHTKLCKHWAACRLWLRVVNGLVCLAIMWTYLGLFTAYRTDIAARAAEADEDDVWTLGQVLSLTTWVPVGIELLSVYIYGARESAEERISSRYKVVDNNGFKVVGKHGVYDKAPNEEVMPLEAAH